MKLRIPAIKLNDSNLSKLMEIFPERYISRLYKVISFCNKNRGGFLSITIDEPFKSRTTGDKSQNHCINGWISFLCQETGEDFSVLKTEVKMRAIKRGYKFRTDIFGNVQPMSETEISTKEAGYLIEEIEQIASELGILLPDRNKI